MSRHRPLIALAALSVGLLDLALLIASDRSSEAIVTGSLSLAIGWSFVGAGLVAWARRPTNPIGKLMCLTGFTWLLSALAASSLTAAYTVGLLFGAAALATSVHVILAFPDGRLASTVERAVVALAYVVAVPLQILALLVLDPATSRVDCSDCPPNALLISADDTMANAIIVVQNLAAVAITVSVIVILARRWRGATSAARRTLAPVLLASSLTLAFGMLLFLSALLWSDGEEVARILTYAALAAVPLAFLVGLLRIRLASFNVIRLNAELARNPAPGRLREALARALGDPSLKLAYWLPETKGYADVHGRPIEELADQPDQVVRIVERDGRRIGAIVHDASLRDQPELVDAVAAAAALALRNEQLQAELLARLDQLSTSEERLRALFDASPLAIVEVDLGGRVTFWNQAAERLYGWTSAEVSGEELSFVPDPAERDELRARLFEGEAISDIETKRLRKDGSLVDVALSAAPVSDRSGRVTRYMAVSADVSERKRAQDELQRERDFITAVLDTAASLVIVTDRQGRFVRFNNACERLTGYLANEVEGVRFWDLFIAPEEVEGVRAAVDRVWSGDFPSENENHWVLRDGSRRLIAWSNMALLGEDGEIEYMVSSGLDVTERKQAEAEVRASRARIVQAGDAERRRLERNLHDGAQQRLVALSLVMRMASAQIRTDPEGAEALLAASDEELSQALTELRELARGIHPAVLTDRGLVVALDALAGRATLPVKLEVAVEERLPAPIEAAAYYVVSEALANIAKYASASEAAIRVYCENGVAQVEVADDGVGGADAGRGSGLRGLADRVEALDGRLAVESPPGRGTRIRAEMPLRDRRR